MEKTQVYMTNQGDHYTNRLSHTLEVTQISRSVASSLGLNQNLIEAISLGHDLGHTPFGHAVESILNKKLPEEGFAHNYQSVLVVDLLENKKFKNNETQNGINLTNYVRYGILHHTKPVKSINTYNRFNDNISVSRQYHSIESELVNKIDTLAYLYHDLEDAINNKNIFSPRLFFVFPDANFEGWKKKINHRPTVHDGFSSLGTLNRHFLLDLT